MIFDLIEGILMLIIFILIIFIFRLYTLRIFSLEYRFKFINHMTKVFLILLNVDLNVENINFLEDAKSYLIVGNHRGILDVVILSSLRKDLSYIGTKEVKSMPLVPLVFQANNSLYLDTENLRESLGVIKEASGRILSGSNIVVFPEGKISNSGELNPFKPGAYKIATMSGAPILPFTLVGTECVFKNFPRKSHVSITFHSPIFDYEYKSLKPIELNTVIVEKVASALK